MSSKADKFKVICSKDNMLLRKNTEMKLFSLEYLIENSKCNITSLLNVNMHNLLYEVNKDIIERIEITPISESEFNILFLFKEFGGDLGGSKTYMYVHTHINTRYTNNQEAGTEIIFTSKSIPYNYHDHLVSLNYKLLEYPLYIKKYIIQSQNKCQVIHMFKLKPEHEEELTVTMENTVSIIIKKMYLRLKIAIENLSMN
jgi:hypothetical protein